MPPRIPTVVVTIDLMATTQPLWSSWASWSRTPRRDPSCFRRRMVRRARPTNTGPGRARCCCCTAAARW